MKCQIVCPVNRDFVKKKERGISFTNLESEVIMKGLKENEFPLEVLEKLRKIDMDEYLSVLPKINDPNNYVILETKGTGHYIGCNYSVSNFQGTWWGEGDDMIWVDGYKWPPDLHGTGSEDYLNQAWGMQDNSFLRNGSSIYERNTGGYQTSYVHHLDNPVRFTKEIKVTIEFGHGNHLRNEVSTVAYWYAIKPTPIQSPPPVKKRQPVRKLRKKWIHHKKNQITTREIPLNAEMQEMKKNWALKHFKKRKK